MALLSPRKLYRENKKVYTMLCYIVGTSFTFIPYYSLSFSILFVDTKVIKIVQWQWQHNSGGGSGDGDGGRA